jgi:hypothetical protein
MNISSLWFRKKIAFVISLNVADADAIFNNYKIIGRSETQCVAKTLSLLIYCFQCLSKPQT